jgi:hypothetical protein
VVQCAHRGKDFNDHDVGTGSNVLVTSNDSSNSNTNDLATIEGAVALQVVDISPENAVFQLSNNTDHPIYLFYEPTANANELSEVYRLSLRCREVGQKEKEYGKYVSHILPELETLDSRKSIQFSVSAIPNKSSKCKLSVPYFDDKSIAAALNDRPLDLNETEKKVAKAGKKSAEIVFKS